MEDLAGALRARAIRLLLWGARCRGCA